MMIDMAKAKPDLERVEQIARFKLLLGYFEAERGLNMSALARKIDRDRSTISSQKTRGPSAEIRELLREKAGVESRYWTSRDRLSPGDCIIDTGARASAAEMKTAISRQRTIAIATRHAAPIDVLAGIATLTPPRGQEDDGWWWIDQYFALVDEHAPATKKRAS